MADGEGVALRPFKTLMQPANWEQLKNIFQAAVELAPAERNSFLDLRCEGNSQLRDEIERLLAAAEQVQPHVLDHADPPPAASAQRALMHLERPQMSFR